MKYDYLIVGSGLFGSVIANELKQHGKKVAVVEKRNHIGGNCYTEEIDGIHVHKHGAHIFRTSKKHIWDYIQQFAEFNNFINSPVANYRGKLYNMPFNMNTFYQMWGTITPAEVVAKIEEQRKEIKGEPKNLEEKAISLVGRDVYEVLVKEYTEKQWGRKCVNLPASILRRLPVRLTYDNNYFNDRYQGIPIGGYRNPLVVVMSISIFALCIQSRISNDMIIRCLKWGASVSFGVYLIHVHPYVWRYIWVPKLNSVHAHNAAEWLAWVLGGTLLVFVGCGILESLRTKLFALLRINRLTSLADRIINYEQ